MTELFRGLAGFDGEPVDAAAVVRRLRLADHVPAERPYVVVNMVATLDGRATVGGRAGPIGNQADRELFHALRAAGDAVMAGAGTVRVERYGRLVRDPSLRLELGSRPRPLAVVVSDSVTLPPDLPLLAEEETEVVVVTASDRSLEAETRASVSYVRRELADALGVLRTEHGVRTVVCEGGPQLNAALFPAGLADELFLCIAPSLAGGLTPTTILTSPILDPPLRLELVWLLESGGCLFGRWRVAGT